MAEHDETDTSEDTASEFAREAERRSHEVVAEFLGLLRHNEKWRLTPIIVVMLLLAGFAFLLGTGAAPLIYALF